MKAYVRIFVTTLVTNLTVVTFIIMVINIYMVSVVAFVLWLFSPMRNVHTGSGTQLDAYCTGSEVSFWGQSGRGVMLPTHLHLALRLRTCRAMPLLPPHASVACAGATVPFCVFRIVPMVTEVSIAFLITVITLGTTISNVLMVTFTYGYLYLWLPLLSGLPWLPTLPLIR
jgi:hypothetical protein